MAGRLAALDGWHCPWPGADLGIAQANSRLTSSDIGGAIALLRRMLQAATEVRNMPRPETVQIPHAGALGHARAGARGEQTGLEGGRIGQASRGLEWASSKRVGVNV